MTRIFQQNMPNLHKRLRPARGFTLIELAVVLSISALLIILVMNKVKQWNEDALAGQAADYMLKAGGALDKYTAVNRTELANSGAAAVIAQPICAALTARTGANIANPLTPTLAELKTGNCLGAYTLAPLTQLRQAVATNITRTNCPGVNCQILSYVYTTTPLTYGGTEPRFDLVAAFIKETKGAGASSKFGAEGTITSATYSTPNPVTLPSGAAAGGVIAVSKQFEQNLYDTFVQIGDTRDPNLQGNLTVAGKVILAGTANEGDVCTPLGAVIRNAANNLLLVCNGTTWKSSTGTPSNIAANAACTIDGQQAINSTGVSYICRGGTWKRLQDLLGNSVEVARAQVQDGSVLAFPACATGGTPAYDLIPIQFTTNVTATPPYEGVQYGAALSGNNWVVTIQLVSPAGNTSGGSNVTGRLRALCLY
jgi:prepilin-type N-terminal cleavage/methylation domain-containing protein